LPYFVASALADRFFKLERNAPHSGTPTHRARPFSF
jgi:hypothetical protein